MRNLVLYHRELGWPLDAMREHFVSNGRLKGEQFDAIASDPEQPAAMPSRSATTLPAIPANRAGTEAMLLTKELGIEPKAGCTCGKLAAAMDTLGVEGCKLARDVLASKMKANAKQWSWLEKLSAGANAVASGIPISPLDPYGSVVDEAIRRAEYAIAV